MSSVTKEQIARAKEVPLLDYLLTHEGHNFKRVGKAYYRRDCDHNSLRVDNNLWYWHSRGFGGNIIDYLVKINGYSFVDAVLHLTGDTHSMPAVPKARAPNAAEPVEREPFRSPPRNTDNKRVIEYLQGRGIDISIIEECIKRGSLYESGDGWHNCVFIGRDERGKGRYAAMRGITGDFKRDANGSDKRFNFTMPPKSPSAQTAACFESAVDAMSHACIDPDFDGWRIALGGTALVALTHFLERHGEVKSVLVCTDDDEAGNFAAKKIAELSGIKAIRALPPKGANDWNEALQKIKNEVNLLDSELSLHENAPTEHRTLHPVADARKDIRFIDSGYNELFRIKDGDRIKITRNDGEIFIKPCRFIDEMHTRIESDDLHICEFAERMERSGKKYEVADANKPVLHVIAAKYGEKLQDWCVDMTEEALRNLVGGNYTEEKIYYGAQEPKNKPYAAILRGMDGMAVVGIGGSNNDKLTSLHPYDAQRQKRELSPAQRIESKEESLLGELAEAKTAVAKRDTLCSGDHAVQRRTTEVR
jgi:hypothetical protein